LHSPRYFVLTLIGFFSNPETKRRDFFFNQFISFGQMQDISFLESDGSPGHPAKPPDVPDLSSRTGIQKFQ
jgi:hypothetical protein